MNAKDLTRRDFSKLSVAALGGALAGTVMVGCGDNKDGDADGKKADDKKGADSGGGDTHNVAYLLEEPHVCRGLNTCKDKGKGGGNDCAGAGACHTARAHACNGENTCKGQGGCGDYPGQNECNTKGKCQVPLHGHEKLDMENTWGKARKAFAKAYADANDGKKLLDAPAADGG